MGDKIKIPETYDKFKDMVISFCKKNFAKGCENGFLEYLSGKEAENHMMGEYESYCREYQQGELTEKQFAVGAIASVSGCLWLMFE